MCQPIYSVLGLVKIDLCYKDTVLKNCICIFVFYFDVFEDYLFVMLTIYLNMEVWGLCIGWWILCSRLCAGYHMGLFGLIRFHSKGLWWRNWVRKKMYCFIRELEGDC